MKYTGGNNFWRKTWWSLEQNEIGMSCRDNKLLEEQIKWPSHTAKNWLHIHVHNCSEIQVLQSKKVNIEKRLSFCAMELLSAF